MTNAHRFKLAGKVALTAALLSGSSLSFAQDAAASVAVAPTPAPVVAAPEAAPKVTPPPAVSTLPSPNDVVNAAAAEEAAAEAAVRRPAAAAPRAAAERPRAVVPARTLPTTAIAPDPVDEPSVTAAPADVVPAQSAIAQDSAPIAPIASEAISESETSSDDMMVVGGLAAALAALGIGVAVASRRRRRTVATDRAAAIEPAPQFVAPKPIKDDPVFQQFAPAPVATPVAAQPVQRVAPVTSRPDVPIVDPLFSRKVEPAPITDPMFAPRNDIEVPITDPLFAKHGRFVGRGLAAPAQQENELVN